MDFCQLKGRHAYFKERNEDLQVVEIKKVSKGRHINLSESQNYLIFKLKGSSELRLDTAASYRLEEREFVFIPSSKNVVLRANEDVEVLIFRMFKRISLKQYYDLEYISSRDKVKSVLKFELSVLTCNNLLTNFLGQLKAYINRGVTSSHFFNLKLEELLLALGWFYTKEELADFFSTQLTQDVAFSDYIIQNARKFQSIGELAEAMNYSVSGFDKKFKRIFGISGYKWMQQQKAQEIYQAICFEHSTFKEIAYSFGFASESYFYEFCKSQFGKTPGQLRKERVYKIVG